MACILDKIVPWGRSYEEYVRMFDLIEAELRLPILGFGDGPAGFNASLTRKGGKVVSIDPLYSFEAPQIRKRVAEIHEDVLAGVRENQSDYVWRPPLTSIQALSRIRMSAMETFLADFGAGTSGGRYVAGELPSLPLRNKSFGLALSSHFLFLYSGQLSLEFHLQAISEMLRVASEVRVFPVLTLDGRRSPHVDGVIAQLRSDGCRAELRRVPYEFQRGGNEMLVIRAAASNQKAG